MKFPILENNELILIDYMPGSSGQLLIRLWSELDSKLNYENSKILSSTSINQVAASREIDYNILIPKRIVNWFLDKCDPSAMIDYAYFFENLATHLIAQEQKWTHQSNDIKFYSNNNIDIKNMRLIYGMHTWSNVIPYNEMINLGYNIKQISIIPITERGLKYQFDRNVACYPSTKFWIDKAINDFNSKPTQNSIDLCTMLVDKNFEDIINWLHTQIGDTFRFEKVEYCNTILNTYYKEIVEKT
jgi:hypothetical protein